MKTTTEDWLVRLSSLAADFKYGILPNEYVYAMMRHIAYGVDSPNPEALLKDLLQPWYLNEQGMEE